MLALRGWLPITATAAGGVILLGAAAALNPQQRNRIGVVLLYGFLAALCLLFLEAASALAAERSIAERILGREIPWAYFNRATTAMALLAWPAAIVLARRRGIYWAAGLLLASFLIFTRFGSRAALLGMLVGGVVFALAFWRPRAATLAPAVLVALVVTAPLLPRLPVLENLSERRDINVSIYQRAAIWQFAAAKIAERPVLGWGLNASRIIPGGREKIGEMAELMPLHPHNAPLQWWLELGGVGALLGAALLAFAIRAIAAMDPSPLGPAAGAGLFTASFVISSISYGIWQGWWMAALWLAAVFMAIVAESRRPAEEPKSSVP
ncbi:MAG: O-antigen ligase family protein [Rhodospirillales bacterium]|nr:O-antigen ligase family protein [Rhodospirillales bacterium]